jgi:3-hydroxybutyryl-CoA dehydratase
MLNLFEIGQVFTQDFLVNEHVYHHFIQAFNDTNPLHTDAAFAKKHQFNSVVMHGNILGGFLSYFVGMALPTPNVMIYSQQMNFKKPVFMNDKLLLEAKVKGLYESVNVVEFKYKFFKTEERLMVAEGNLQIGILQ